MSKTVALLNKRTLGQHVKYWADGPAYKPGIQVVKMKLVYLFIWNISQKNCVKSERRTAYIGWLQAIEQDLRAFLSREKRPFRAYCSANIGSDHFVVLANIEVKKTEACHKYTKQIRCWKIAKSNNRRITLDTNRRWVWATYWSWNKQYWRSLLPIKERHK